MWYYPLYLLKRKMSNISIDEGMIEIISIDMKQYPPLSIGLEIRFKVDDDTYKRLGI